MPPFAAPSLKCTSYRPAVRLSSPRSSAANSSWSTSFTPSDAAAAAPARLVLLAIVYLPFQVQRLDEMRIFLSSTCECEISHTGREGGEASRRIRERGGSCRGATRERRRRTEAAE